MDTTRFLRTAHWPLYALLTLLVWGIGPCQRGPWQDDVQGLWNGERVADGQLPLFGPVVAPTRRLQLVPYLLAHWSGHDVAFLQLLLGLTWFAQGWAAHALARELLPRRPEAALFAGALTLCATSDLLTNSLVGLVYFLAATEVTAAMVFALAALRRRHWGFAVLSCALLAASLFTADSALPFLPFVPILFWLASDFHGNRWNLGLSAAWAVTTVPYLRLLVPFLRSSTSYAAVAVLPLTISQRLDHALQLFALNFQPWSWVFRRVVWLDMPVEPALPRAAFWLATVLGTAAFFALAARTGESAPTDRRDHLRVGSVVLLFLLAAFAANAAFGSLQLWNSHYRTHIMSRVWASLAIAAAASWLLRSHRWARWPAIAGVAVFVGFGIWGGVERQSFYRFCWIQHQRELSSLVEAAPALAPDTIVLLWKPERSKVYSATEAEYLASAWLARLYHDHGMRERTVLWAPARHAACRPEEHDWKCSMEGFADCLLARTCPGRSVPFARTLVLRYDEQRGTYDVVDELPDEMVGSSPHARTEYRGRALIRRQPMQPYQRRFLLLD